MLEESISQTNFQLLPIHECITYMFNILLKNVLKLMRIVSK